jgi:cell division protein FtsB
VIGVVALNAMFAQTAFAVHATQARVADLRDERAVLATEAARLSSPGRIADWAATDQMVPAGDVVILHVSGRGLAGVP